jgi:hypothetical protein
VACGREPLLSLAPSGSAGVPGDPNWGPIRFERHVRRRHVRWGPSLKAAGWDPIPGSGVVAAQECRPARPRAPHGERSRYAPSPARWAGPRGPQRLAEPLSCSRARILGAARYCACVRRGRDPVRTARSHGRVNPASRAGGAQSGCPQRQGSDAAPFAACSQYDPQYSGSRSGVDEPQWRCTLASKAQAQPGCRHRVICFSGFMVVEAPFLLRSRARTRGL